MTGITARRIITDMVDDECFCSPGIAWQWRDQPRVDNPMDQFLASPKDSLTIPMRQSITRPNPTIVGIVDLDFGKEPFNLVFWNGRDGKIFGSHLVSPFQTSDRSELERLACCSNSSLIITSKWDKQVRSLSWLLDRFAPVPGWTEQDLEKVING